MTSAAQKRFLARKASEERLDRRNQLVEGSVPDEVRQIAETFDVPVEMITSVEPNPDGPPAHVTMRRVTAGRVTRWVLTCSECRRLPGAFGSKSTAWDFAIRHLGTGAHTEQVDLGSQLVRVGHQLRWATKEQIAKGHHR